MYTNLRSIMNKSKLDEIRYVLQNKGVDILGITETWLHEGIGDAEIAISGYKIFRKDRVKGAKVRGGGVMLYIKEDLTVLETTDSQDKSNESVWVRLMCSKNKSKEIEVGVCYRSPSASAEEKSSLWDSIKRHSRVNTVVIGDFNYGDIDWKVVHTTGEGQEFIDLINDCFLVQHVETCTRGLKILDLIFSTELDMIENIEIGCPVSNSDHCTITWELICDSIQNTDSIKTFDYHKGNYKKITARMKNVNWGESLKNIDVQGKWDVFLDQLNHLRDTFIPVKKFKNKPLPPWMRAGIIKMIKTRNRAWAKYVHCQDYNAEKGYKIKRNKVNLEVRKAKKDFELKLATRIKEDPKSFYAYVKSKSVTKAKVGPLVDVHGTVVADSVGMGRLLNNYFSSVFTTEDLSKIPELNSRLNCDRRAVLSCIDISELKIREAIRCLKLNKAAGVDGLTSTLLKESLEGIIEPLGVIFRESLDTGEIPKDWKLANVTAIYKKGSKKLPENYRPISLTSHICKILERIIKNELVQFLECNKIINETQHGFRNNKSCLTNLLEFMETVTKIVDNGTPVDIIYLDFQKAFDKVPHERLMLKLKSIGVEGKLLLWIREWLKGRKQRVLLDGEYSDWVDVTSGVPQGSVLGPILFIIYINDIDTAISSNIFKFADDTKLVGKLGGVGDGEDLKKDLEILECWSKDWQMQFNLSKCKVMHLGYRNKQNIYQMGGVPLVEVSEEKDLGVIISNDLKVGKQCHKAAKMGNSVLGLISRTFSFKTITIIRTLYKSLVRTHLDYCIQAWRPYLMKDIAVLERVQRRATRMAVECRGRNYQERLKLLNLTTLETRMLRSDLIEVFKILKGLEGLKEDSFFTRGGGTSRGHSSKLFKNRFNLDVRKYSFSNRVINEWNILPESVVQVSSINVYKSKLDHYLEHMRGLK